MDPELPEGRTLQVKLYGVLSKPGEVIAGVPNGGVISPTLFNVHIDDIEKDIPRDLGTTTCKYADECTQYQIVPLNSENRMQVVMNHFESWSVRWNSTPRKRKRCGFPIKSDVLLHLPYVSTTWNLRVLQNSSCWEL